MADDKKPAIPHRLKKWRSEGTVVELLGEKIWVHDQGPKTDDAVFFVN